MLSDSPLFPRSELGHSCLLKSLKEFLLKEKVLNIKSKIGCINMSTNPSYQKLVVTLVKKLHKV